MFLLNAVIKKAFSGDVVKAVLLIVAKIALYGACLAPVIIFMGDDIYYAAAGFAVGLPGVALVNVLIKKPKKEGDDTFDNGSDS